MNDVNIVPGRKVLRNFGVRAFIGGAQVRQRLSGKHHTPTKGVVGAIAFIYGDLVGGVGGLHEDGEVHAGRAATDDVYFHLASPRARFSSSVRSNRVAQSSR